MKGSQGQSQPVGADIRPFDSEIILGRLLIMTVSSPARVLVWCQPVISLGSAMRGTHVGVSQHEFVP